jgi:hypothetical protein
MNPQNLANMSLDQLVDLFAENAIEQDRVIFKEQVSKYKKVFGEMGAINAELKRRGPQGRLALTRLYTHPNMQVRLQAARSTLAVAAAEARQIIETISKSGRFPQAGDAGMCLWNLDEGILKPD